MATWSKGKARGLAIATRTGAVYLWEGETGWVEDGEEVSGGMMEGIGIPTSQSFLFFLCSRNMTDQQERTSRHTKCTLHQTDRHWPYLTRTSSVCCTKQSRIRRLRRDGT